MYMHLQEKLRTKTLKDLLASLAEETQLPNFNTYIWDIQNLVKRGDAVCFPSSHHSA